MSNHYGTEDELRSITFRDDDEDYYRGPGRGGYDDGGGYYEDDYYDAPPPPPPSYQRRRRRNRTKTALLILLSLVLMLGGGLVLGAYLISEKYGGQTKRENTFGALNEKERPKKAAGAENALNFVLAGTDARTDGQKTTGKDAGEEWSRGGKRSDTIMIVHITSNRDKAYLISIPRDSYVEIPDRGKHKINSAYSMGGSSLYVRTVEKLTNVRMDHYAAIDWEGFKDLTNALGGVEMDFPETTKLASGRQIPPGSHSLNGDDALDYVRKRKGLAEGDFDRVKRQQNFLRSLMKQTLSNGTLSNPAKLAGALDAVTSNLSVDEKFTNDVMRSLAWDMRSLRSSNVEFMTVPLAKQRFGTVKGEGSVVYLDEPKVKALFDAVKKDKVDDWLKANDADTLGQKVN